MSWNPNIELLKGIKEEVHKKFLREAYSYAWKNSDDIVTKTGAVLINPDLTEILAYGANHLPEGLNPTEEQLLDREWKYKHMIHAEPASIYAAAKKGKTVEHSVMYMPWVPCTPCALAIRDSGVKTLIGHKEMIMKTPERWWESTNYALDLLDECGVERFMCEGKIGGVKNLFDGVEWEP